MNAQKLVALIISIGLFLSANIFATDPGTITYVKSTQIVLNTGATGANITGDLKNLPVLIKLDNTNFDFTKAKAGLAGDLKISLSDGSCLSYYVQKYEKANNIAEVWVIVPKVLGNNNTQAITISYGENKDAITDQKMKERVDAKETQEINVATSLSAGSLFKSSYEIYGVWTSNSGFSITGLQSGM